MVRPIRGYEGPTAGVSVPGFPASTGQEGAGFSQLGRVFFQQAQNFQRMEDKRAIAAARQSGMQAGLNEGGYQLADEGTLMGAAFNEMARDTFAKQLESKTRSKVVELSQQYAADPVKLAEQLDAYSAGIVEETETFDPMISAGFQNVFGVLKSAAVADATENARKVAIDANRAAISEALTQRGAAISQNMRKAGAGDQEAHTAAVVDRDLMVADLMKAGPAAPFDYNGEQMPAGSGALTVQEIQEKVSAIDAEMDEQAILGWWGAGSMDPARADEWYKSDVPGMTQDRKDQVYRVMQADIRDVQIQRDRAEAEATRNAAIVNAQRGAELAIKISRGQAGYADLEAAYDGGRGWMSPGDYAQYTIALDKANNKIAEQQAALALVQAAYAGDVNLDPKNSDHKDLVNTDFQQRLTLWAQPGDKTDADADAFAVDYALRVGIVPEDIKSKWRGALASGDDDQKIAAANAIEQLRTANPALLSMSFSQEEIESATMLADQSRAGVPVERAVQNVADAMRVDSATRDARDAAFTQAFKAGPGQTQAQAAASTLGGMVNSAAEKWVGWVPGFADNPTVPDGMAAEFLSLTKDAYRRTGDIEVAKKTAADSLRNVWGVSGVNGGRKWMKYAPETYYAAPAGWNLSTAENTDWIKAQLVEDISRNSLWDVSAGDLADRVSLVPDSLNRRDPQGRPVYQVIVTDQRGMMAPMIDAKGKPLVWQPDWNASTKLKELQLARTQEYFDARLNRAGTPPTKAVGALGTAAEVRTGPKLERSKEGEIGYYTGKEKEGPVYVAGDAKPKGLVEPGNIDLNKRPIVKNSDGSISTERSLSFEENGKEVLIPTVVDGKILDGKAAIEHYRKTGEHLGKFDNPADADAYAERLHQDQAEFYSGKKKRPGKKAREFVPVTDKGESGVAKYLNP